MNTRLIGLVAGLIAAAPASAGIEDDLAACVAIADKLERLVCYDELAARVAGAPAARKTESKPPEPADPEAEFGIVERKEPVKPKKSDKSDLDKIYGEVADVDRDPYGGLIVTFANGQVWKQIDDGGFLIRKGDTLFVKKGALRSYRLGSDEHNATIRVKRIR